MSCPVCDGPARERGSCSCGYDFATGNVRVAYEQAKDTLAKTTPRAHNWLAVVASTLPAILYTGAVPELWLWVIGALLVGVPPLIRRGQDQEAAALRIQRAERLMLPAARVVDR